MLPSREEFAAWLSDPVTEAVMRAHVAMAEAGKSAWIDASWGNGACSKEMLAELRTRADAYMAIAEMNYEALCGALGEEPNDQ